MSEPVPYFHSPVADVCYYSVGYLRVNWQPGDFPIQALQAVYDCLLRGMDFYCTGALMSVHSQRILMPDELQAWLTQEWIPRATEQVHYQRCAIVNRLAGRAIGASLRQPLACAYFLTVEEADQWLQRA